MREFKTGATRNFDENKLDYEIENLVDYCRKRYNEMGFMRCNTCPYGFRCDVLSSIVGYIIPCEWTEDDVQRIKSYNEIIEVFREIQDKEK